MKATPPSFTKSPLIRVQMPQDQLKRPKVEYSLEAFRDAEHYCYLAFKEFQKASDDLDILNDASKDILAVSMSELDKPEEKISEAKLERMARCSEAWKIHKRGLTAAIQIHGRAKAKYYSWVRAFDCIQSGISYRKAELQKLGVV